MPDSISSMPSSASPKKGAPMGLIIAVVVVVILAAVAYFMFSGGLKPKPGGQPTSPSGQTSQTEQAPVPTPNEVYSYVGEVKSVGNGQITVFAKKEMNLLAADATLTVKADANTQVIKRTIPRVLPEEGGAGLFKQENISVSDIAVGDQVTVVASTNLRGVTTFTASRIEVLNVQ
ncbi:MAG: hypothetical protein UV57_C0009G0018 [Parcubacteria group bacterium GW2011_GWD2_43_10]|uniref:DUF5666 domain-containing protein n=2 Tax=Candidatus Vebleniibacteriota TaxID=1817921 RepID=A0A1G2Q5P7_9BACT|nr:MAG: hypothetical protein UV57_C0009G0018 [Parcubacteria group bacterium GW2011_GWD2_43_10]OHA55201.1 MAG: hypothetical protein A2226_02960 [Candidatus Veblenbacteria bacterium RIFOXYA2_FULL_43_9]OHA56261.1 MAG: hypothetical protein A2441_03345 [Candidatus Veblenbacteria bacterium RIFOXYC2_FULL_42_11]HBT92652.1 hypothetical protein [Candidatus Veblenbacteria bacterium]